MPRKISDRFAPFKLKVNNRKFYANKKIDLYKLDNVSKLNALELERLLACNEVIRRDCRRWHTIFELYKENLVKILIVKLSIQFLSIPNWKGQIKM